VPASQELEVPGPDRAWLGDGFYDAVMRSIFADEHQAIRESFASFVAKELIPDYEAWEAAGIAPREIFTKAGEYGFIGMAIPEEHGGGGVDDFRFNLIIAEELRRSSGARSCSSEQSTSACSCSGATATCWSTRSHGHMPMRGSPPIYGGTSEVMKTIIAKSIGL
jgi:alkylation response protein AidB-like acyl-CoA dehydrogenase